MRYIYHFIIAILLISCDSSDTTTALYEAQKVIEQAHKGLGPVADGVSGKTAEEIQKLTKIEYQVLTLPRDTGSAALQQTLRTAGDERWDCYEVIPQDDRLTIVCKRLPISYLKLLSGFVF